MPIAHGLVGAMAVAVAAPACVRNRAVWPLVAGAFLAISPDFDFFFEWVLGWSDAHRTVTHALPFAFVLGLVMLWRVGDRRLAFALTLALASHGLLDFAGSMLTRGVMLWWPFSFSYYKLGLIGISEIETGLATLGALQHHLGQLFIYLGIEMVIFGPLFLLVYYVVSVTTGREVRSERRVEAG